MRTNSFTLKMPAVLALIALAVSATANSDIVNCKNTKPQAVSRVERGDLAVANAAWWGFDEHDATACLQSAIDSGAEKVVVPYMGAPWIVTPIKLSSNQEIIFEPGVLVLAKKGAFKGRGDSMFSADCAQNVTLRGYGATLRMRKEDYQSDAYEKAEWRMVLDFGSCRNVRVLGLRLESSGGDGIYLGVSGNGKPYCEDVLIRDVVCHDNHRQGISVISAQNLRIENCVLSGTDGTAPQAGIDFEPNHPNERLLNCVMTSCLIEGNSGAGVLIYLKNLSRESEPVSITCERCYVRSGKDVGLGVGAIKDNGPQGRIEFLDCTIENTRGGGIFVYDKHPASAEVAFVNCNWLNVGCRDRSAEDARKTVRGTPLLLTALRLKVCDKLGGITFNNCHVYDKFDRPVLVAEDLKKAPGLYNVKGNITAHNPHGARVILPEKQVDVDLDIVSGGEDAK